LPPSPRPASVSQATATTPGAGRAGLAAADAVAVARSFLAAEIGMTDLVAGPFQRTTRTTGEVAFRIRHGEGGSLAPPTVPRTVVQLEQAAAGWVVAAVHADAIEVTAPGRLAAISSPVTVTGMASAFEGTVQVAVKAAGPGTGRLLGRGFVTGSGSATPGPFHGSIAFSQPSTGTGTGWIIFYEGNEASEASPVLQATAVRIRFAGHR
jgi:hypothetical protein